MATPNLTRNIPYGKYSGLTIVLNNPSRFDTVRLLQGSSGILVNEALSPVCSLMQCDVRVMECMVPLLPDTKCVLLLGEQTMHAWCPEETKDNTLNEMRGSVLQYKGIPAIASYFPQDACDMKNWESTLNENSKDFVADDELSEDSEDEGDVKRFSPTKRSNYAFWLRADIWKVKQILQDKMGWSRIKGLICGPKPSYHLSPPAQEVVQVLRGTKNSFFYFDMETDYEEQNLLCFSFSFDGVNIYCVPILDGNYHPAYSAYHLILRALAVAIRDNIIVAHNGAAFDFFVLGFKYRIPVHRCYDTMLAQHRCFPCIEKSLGHCTSYWTWEKFHKDTDSRAYFTQEHVKQKLKYCGADVYTMVLIHREIEKFSETIPGLESSIKCANDSIVPYLCMTIQGIAFDDEDRQRQIRENDRLMMQYCRMINLLIGLEGLVEIRSYLKGKPKLFPGSNKQCCAYFHLILGYPVLFKSPQTGDPSLGKKIMYRLAMNCTRRHASSQITTQVYVQGIPYEYKLGFFLLFSK